VTVPRVAITMGAAAGVGPELIALALADPAVQDVCRPLVVGDLERLRRAAEITRSPVPDPVIQVASLPPDLPFGAVSAAAGDAAYRYLEHAVSLALEGHADAVCTCPINKEALNAAGHAYPGHTELLAELTGASEVAMLLTGPRLRVVHVTTHLGLAEAIERIEPRRVRRVIDLGAAALRAMGVDPPRIAVCAINPHAGEGGLFGRGEEAAKILPAVEDARAAGLDVTGPIAADTAFMRAARGDFDLVVAMYHDQGHAPVKVLAFDETVNVTLGLPVVRTSVDHGTAYDLAGTGRASPAGLVAALREAARLAARH
jgi:4-phospho-D-threonate 3-dehydrogenase / 4-phospho-D-erythronate 3-dehydrogenase